MKYLPFAERLALVAGKIISEKFQLRMEKKWKEDSTPLTETDLLINALVVEEVARCFPDHAVLAEEGDLEKAETHFVWVCDPLDGTIPYSHGVPVCVFSLALVENGVPEVGVIYDPFMKRLFSAGKGRGAMLNGRPILVSQEADFSKMVIGMGYAWFQRNLLDAMGELIEKKISFVQFASSLYMSSLVACGEFTANIFTGNLPWDAAAAKIIVEEAGGRVTDLFGSEQRYDCHINGALITNGRVHDEILRVIERTVSK